MVQEFLIHSSDISNSPTLWSYISDVVGFKHVDSVAQSSRFFMNMLAKTGDRGEPSGAISVYFYRYSFCLTSVFFIQNPYRSMRYPVCLYLFLKINTVSSVNILVKSYNTSNLTISPPGITSVFPFKSL